MPSILPCGFFVIYILPPSILELSDSLFSPGERVHFIKAAIRKGKNSIALSPLKGAELHLKLVCHAHKPYARIVARVCIDTRKESAATASAQEILIIRIRKRIIVVLELFKNSPDGHRK
jgi:hypothetical protein